MRTSPFVHFVIAVVVLPLATTSCGGGSQAVRTSVPSPAEASEGEWTDWMPDRVYQAYFENRVNNHREFSIKVEGRVNEDGVEEFRSMFVPVYDEPFWFYEYRKMDSSVYSQRDAGLSGKGYERVWHQEFVNSNGGQWHQAVWVRTQPNQEERLRRYRPILTRAVGPPRPLPESVRIVFQSNREGSWDLFSMNPDGSDLINLTSSPSHERYPSCSPDGSKIAFYSDRDGNREVYVMNVDGTDLTRLTNHPGRDEMPDWSPDGSMLVFQTNRDEDWEIYVMTADGSDQRNLSNNKAGDFRPKWSPEGSKIAFQTDRVGGSEIYQMNPDGSDQIRLVMGPGEKVTVSFSNDGSRLTFVGGDGDSEIYVMSREVTVHGKLTNNTALDALPAWSPDDHFIAFRSERDGNSEIYIMESNGSHQKRLTTHPASDYGPTWCKVSGG